MSTHSDAIHTNMNHESIRLLIRNAAICPPLGGTAALRDITSFPIPSSLSASNETFN
jgi:hypothetical protein